MNAQKTLERMFARRGQRVLVQPKNEASVSCKALLEPLHDRTVTQADELQTAWGGYGTEDRFYLGPISCRLDQYGQGAVVREEHNGASYFIVRAGCRMFGDEPLYVWAVLQKAVE